MRRTNLPLWLLAFATLANAADTVDVSVSPEHAVQDGQWKYAVRRSARPWACGKADQQTCVEQDVLIDNASGRTLECQLHVDYTQAGKVVASFDAPALVLPRSKERVHRRHTYADLQAEVGSLDCKARAPYQRLPKTAGCQYEMKGDPLDTYYPEAAVVRALEGPVTVAFSLPEKSGPAKDIVVADSSLMPELDEAAIRFIAAQRFTTACPGTRFDVRVRFRLRENMLAVN